MTQKGSRRRGDLADADGDGLTNLEEAYFGFAPNHFDTPAPVTFVRESATGNFVVRWSRDPFDRGIRAALSIRSTSNRGRRWHRPDRQRTHSRVP